MEPGIRQFSWTPENEAILLGQVHPLLEQLGTPSGLAMLNASTDALFCPKIDDLETLGVFLEAYQEQLLYPIEWPAIVRAHRYAAQNQTRELIDLDRSIASQLQESEFARASRRVGQTQLQRLRPLRDHRLVQRYLEAVDQQQAHGWHTLVFGLTLAVYSLPVRQAWSVMPAKPCAALSKPRRAPCNSPPRKYHELLERQCLDIGAQLEKLLLNAQRR